MCEDSTLDIDAGLLEETTRLSGMKTRSAAVQGTLEEYVRLRRKERLLKLPGRVLLEENWRELREMERRELAGPG